jgi:hypothetical protein
MYNWRTHNAASIGGSNQYVRYRVTYNVGAHDLGLAKERPSWHASERLPRPSILASFPTKTATDMRISHMPIHKNEPVHPLSTLDV